MYFNRGDVIAVTKNLDGSSRAYTPGSSFLVEYHNNSGCYGYELWRNQQRSSECISYPFPRLLKRCCEKIDFISLD